MNFDEYPYVFSDPYKSYSECFPAEKWAHLSLLQMRLEEIMGDKDIGSLLSKKINYYHKIT